MNNSNPFSPQESSEVGNEGLAEISPENLPKVIRIDILVLNERGIDPLNNVVHKRVEN